MRERERLSMDWIWVPKTGVNSNWPMIAIVIFINKLELQKAAHQEFRHGKKPKKQVKVINKNENRDASVVTGWS